MTDPRRTIGTGAVLALVLLRLVIGWHFFTQGAEKIDYDARTGQFRMTFSAAGFLSQAKGPLAEFFHSQAPNGHDWTVLLAVPRQDTPLTADDAKERAAWTADYQRRRAEAEKNKTPVPVEIPPFAPYHDWATRIVDDWKVALQRVTAIAVLSDEQKQAAADAFTRRHQELADYLAGEGEAITDYQHQLWRLANWRSGPEAGGVPFEQQRIATKTTETTLASQPWVNQVDEFEQAYLNDLSGVLNSEQRADAATAAAMDEAQTLPRQKWLNTVNLIVTVLTIGVGICLLLGFFTRLASLAGALFLLAVIATQPPWVADAQSTIMQAIELAGLLVLAGTGAGRWLGLDFFTFAVFSRFRRADIHS